MAKTKTAKRKAKKAPPKKTTKRATTKKATAKTASKTTAKKKTKTTRTRTTKTPDDEVTIDRRRKDRRASANDTSVAETTSVAATESAEVTVAQPERRKKVPRRRQIDPTTCERDYSDDEIEFMHALDEYKRANGRMFPTCSEILEVVRDLGYQKVEKAPTGGSENSISSDTTVEPAGVGEDRAIDEVDGEHGSTASATPFPTIDMSPTSGFESSETPSI